MLWSPHTTTRERKTHVPQLERISCAAMKDASTKIPCAATKTRHSQINKQNKKQNKTKNRYTKTIRNFPGCPVVKNPPSNAGDMGLIPGRGTKIPHTLGQLSPCATNYRAHAFWSPHAPTKSPPAERRSRVMQLRPDAAKNK